MGQVSECTAHDQQQIALSGHETWGIHELFPDRRCRYVTILRNPVERVVSFYRYEKARLAGQFDRYAFIKSNGAGFIWLLGEGTCKDAKRRVLEDYDAFGLAEEYGLSMVLFRERYGLEFLDDRILNATHAKREPDREERELRDALMESMRDELELYACFQNEFRQRTKGLTVPSGAAKGEKPVVTYVDPLKEGKDHVEDLLQKGKTEDAITAIEAMPEQNHHLVELLVSLHEKAGNRREAARWARTIADSNLGMRLRFIDLQAKDARSRVTRIIQTIRELGPLMTVTRDSAINGNLRSLSYHLAKALTDLSSEMGADKANELLLKRISDEDYWRFILRATQIFMAEMEEAPV